MGRAEELQRLRRLLAQSRLVTVAGGAGIGKSTLAAHAAAAVGGQLPDGVVMVRWWDGGPPVRGRSVARAVVLAMDGETDGGGREDGDGKDHGDAREYGDGRQHRIGVAGDRQASADGQDGRAAGRSAGGRQTPPEQTTHHCAPHPHPHSHPPEDTQGSADPLNVSERELISRLRDRRVLVVLDDFDPVRDECVRLVQFLLQRAPGVRVLATGRHPLGLGQELVLRLGPLPVTVPGAGEEPGPAVRLFMERARGVRLGASPEPLPEEADEAELRAVSDICARLEGVPLAVELAAEQTAQHPPAQLARMLRPAQGWLGRPEAPLRRHRSLRAAVGASYALCGQAERSVWARLSVFAGAFDEDAAVHVCAGGGLAPARVASCLARLVLASVLEPVRDPGGVLQPRYRLSAAARGFGAERLESVGESAAAAARHLTWYSTVASTAHQLWSTGRHEQATLLLSDEEPNLRAALERGPHTADQSATALGMAVDLWFWWAVCGHAAEGREHLRRLLPLGRSDTLVCGRALWLAGWLAACTGSPDAGELLGQAWRVAVLTGDDATVGRVSHAQGILELRGGDTERAIEHLREAAHTIPSHAVHGPPAAVSWAELAVVQARVRPADALRSVRRASAGTQLRHDIWTRSVTQYAHALVEHLRGRRSSAWRRAHKSLAAVTSVAGPLGGASVRQLIAEIERGPALGGAAERIPPCGWNPPGT
ncbi:ATP-binding protein [Streptomyces sp. NPDC048441]|uniref:ATP-binding protein n=1 Tax=Streptomyces sp. NPDC048441 TaxID=3365552 RepID=UPI003715DAC7